MEVNRTRLIKNQRLLLIGASILVGLLIIVFALSGIILPQLGRIYILDNGIDWALQIIPDRVLSFTILNSMGSDSFRVAYIASERVSNMRFDIAMTIFVQALESNNSKLRFSGASFLKKTVFLHANKIEYIPVLLSFLSKEIEENISLSLILGLCQFEGNLQDHLPEVDMALSRLNRIEAICDIVEFVKPNNPEYVQFLLDVWSDNKDKMPVYLNSRAVVDALKSYSGNDFGYEIEPWIQWWRSEIERNIILRNPER